MKLIEKWLGLKGRLLVQMFLTFLLPFTLLRGIFYLCFHSTSHAAIEGEYFDLLKAFYLGLKFDTRVILVFLLPMALGMLFPALDPFKNRKSIPLWTLYGTFLFVLSFLFYALDFGYYSYLGLRVNATLLQFFENPLISAEMVWETYPVLPIIFALLSLSGLFIWSIYRFLSRQNHTHNHSHLFPPNGSSALYTPQWVSVLLVVGFFIGGLYGKLSAYPLRWSEAYFSTDSFISSLGTNPIHYFFDTFKNRETPFSRDKVKKYYPLISAYLGVDHPDINKLNFDRQLKPRPQLPSNTNVVIILMESFAAHKTGTFGHPLKPTPYFDQLAEQGKLFTQYHVPSEGTARSIFGLVTGLPDVNPKGTSSRNPLIVDQHTLINAFTQHKKFYFIGGSANWGNIRGVIANNIPDMKIIEEGMFESKTNDVWGISDYQLFNEAHRQLSQLPPQESFFTIIQTAGFHRPYTIPNVKGEFVRQEITPEETKKYGFVSSDEYNSLRFADYSLGHFFAEARKSPYFKNTLFVIIGDHGLPDLDAEHLSTASRFHHLTRFHVPLLFYHDSWKTKETFDFLATEPDLLVTIASMTGHSALVRNLGRDLWDPRFKNQRMAFHYVYYRSPPLFAVLDDHYYLTAEPKRILGFYDLSSPHPDQTLTLSTQIQGVLSDQLNDSQDLQERKQKLSDFAFGLYETSKYLLYHNPNPLHKNQEMAKNQN